MAVRMQLNLDYFIDMLLGHKTTVLHFHGQEISFRYSAIAHRWGRVLLQSTLKPNVSRGPSVQGHLAFSLPL